MDRQSASGHDALIDPADLRRLKWRCRRGLLENDLLVNRFFAHHEDGLTVRQGKALTTLMNLSDRELLDLLLRRSEPDGDLDRSDIVHVLALLRPPLAGDEAPKVLPPTSSKQPGSENERL